MTLNDAEIKAIRLINNYSNNGSLISPSSGNYQDYLLRMPDLANDAQQQIAKYVKINAVHKVTQNPITNLLGLHTGFDITQFTGTDLSYSAKDVKSYHFEVDRQCTVYFEEEIAGVWTELEHVTVPNTVTYFTAYKGNLAPSSATNNVRMRFTGSYVFNTRNRALFAYAYASDNDVPTYKPYVPYELPTDFLEFNKVMRQFDQRQYVDWYDYKFTGKKTVELNWFLPGEFAFHYYKKPTTITSATATTYEFEIDEHAQNLIPYYIGAHVIMDENQAIGGLLLNEYQNKLANLSETDAPGEYQPITASWG